MKFVRGASSAHKRPHTLCMGQLCFTWANFLRVPMHNTLFWSTASIRVLGNWLASPRNCHTSLRHMAFWEASWGLPWQETQDIPTPPKSTFDGIKHALLAIRVEFFSPYQKSFRLPSSQRNFVKYDHVWINHLHHPHANSLLFTAPHIVDMPIEIKWWSTIPTSMDNRLCQFNSKKWSWNWGTLCVGLPSLHLHER